MDTKISLNFPYINGHLPGGCKHLKDTKNNHAQKNKKQKTNKQTKKTHKTKKTLIYIHMLQANPTMYF